MDAGRVSARLAEEFKARGIGYRTQALDPNSR